MKKIVINNIRNVKHLEFEIPSYGVHILSGENGSGKTTLLACLNRICNSNAFRIGFPTTSIQNYDEYTGSITYCTDTLSVRYTKRASGRWQPDTNGDVFSQFGFTDVVHISTKSERIFTQVIDIPRKQVRADDWLISALNSIMQTERFTPMIRITVGDLRSRTGNADQRRRNTAFAIPQGRGRYFTEQNFSFGEIVLLNLLYDIERVENNSLVLIDELEMALHPAAQIRLIQLLKDLANEKHLTIIISTHSSSIIKSQKYVILLEQSTQRVCVIYNCPPAKAIGAIGMREDTMADIIVIVEDEMAKALFMALLNKYNTLCPDSDYLDVRVLGVGGYPNIINFYVEAENYIFYDNVYVTAFLDKDVETDIIPFKQFGNRDIIEKYEANTRRIKFLPYTPEVLLYQEMKEHRVDLLANMRRAYSNQQLNYNVQDIPNFVDYDNPLPNFATQNDYNATIQTRGSIRNACKNETEQIANLLSRQLNISESEIYRYIFRSAVEHMEGNTLNVRAFLASTMKRL
jgi:predicted ATPase